MKNNEFKEIVFLNIEKGYKTSEIAERLQVSNQLVYYYVKLYRREKGINTNPKDEQLEKDLRRITNKQLRKESRAENLLKILFKDVKKAISSEDRFEVKPRSVKEEDKIGIIQFSDLHFGEVVSLSTNEYNLEVAIQRLNTHIEESTKYFKSLGVKDIYLFFTGDLLNSDRRYDELLTNTCNRAKALVYLFRYFDKTIQDISKEFNILGIESVVGNESRIDLDLSGINSLASNNFDFIFHEMLRAAFPNLVSDVLEGAVVERCVKIKDEVILLTHGMYFKANDVFDTIPRYAQENYGYVTYTMCGHIHDAVVTAHVGRSGGLPGGNDYSRRLKCFNTLAAQNCYIIDSFGVSGKINVLV